MNQRTKIIDLLKKIRMLKKEFHFLNILVSITLIIMLGIICFYKEDIIDSLKYIILILIICIVLIVVNWILAYKINKLYDHLQQLIYDLIHES